jgi:hypothetical protein
MERVYGRICKNSISSPQLILFRPYTISKQNMLCIKCNERSASDHKGAIDIRYASRIDEKRNLEKKGQIRRLPCGTNTDKKSRHFLCKYFFYLCQRHAKAFRRLLLNLMVLLPTPTLQ